MIGYYFHLSVYGEYMDFHVQCFIAFLQTLVHISMILRDRGFKFAGAPVQRLYLVMVALTQNQL